MNNNWCEETKYSRLFHNERIYNKGEGNKFLFQTKNQNILPGTVFGFIYSGMNETEFSVNSTGKVTCIINTENMSSIDCVGYFNHNNGRLALTWDSGDVYVVVNYECEKQ